MQTSPTKTSPVHDTNTNPRWLYYSASEDEFEEEFGNAKSPKSPPKLSKSANDIENSNNRMSISPLKRQASDVSWEYSPNKSQREISTDISSPVVSEEEKREQKYLCADENCSEEENSSEKFQKEENSSESDPEYSQKILVGNEVATKININQNVKHSAPGAEIKNYWKNRRKVFACQNTPEELKSRDQINLNKEITEILQILEHKSIATGDKWRSYAYKYFSKNRFL
jgi:hypothetical protein